MTFRKTPSFFILSTGLIFALPALAQPKPFTTEQVSNRVRDGFGDESDAKLIEHPPYRAFAIGLPYNGH
jgi:hypothetical protein